MAFAKIHRANIVYHLAAERGGEPWRRTSPAPRSSARKGEPPLDSPQDSVIVLGGGAAQEMFLRDLHARYGAFTLLDVDPAAPGRHWARNSYQASIYDFDACRTVLAPLITPESRLVTFATGPAGEVCCRLGEAFGLPRRSKKLAAAANDKKILSDILASNGMLVPRQLVLHNGALNREELDGMTFPAVLKPLRGGGGRDVRSVSSADEAARLCSRIDRPFLLQEKLAGREELLWLIARNGEVAALLHGENLFDGDTGWNSPLGLAIERTSLRNGIPPRWAGLAAQLIGAFDLKDDFIVAELIAGEGGDTVIDVELNGLSGFACAAVMGDNLLVSLLVDTYLQRDFSGPPRAGWVSCMAFFAAPNPQALKRMAERAARLGSCAVESPRHISKLECFGATVYKGGYLIVTDARDLADAADKARGLLREASR
jgi:hypothetical protein